MTFTSLEFAVFFAIFFVLYWFVFNRTVRIQNVLILLASYLFYGWWDWRFLSLIFVSSAADYSIGLALGRTELPSRRKLLLGLSLAVNLGILGFFKYFNFFIDSLRRAFDIAGVANEFSTLDIILPLGISFYTLQTLSYTIDVYRRKIEPTRDAVSFFAYVSFFPQLVAGPIERAGNLIPQFQRKRVFTYERAADGSRQVLWGLFKKMVIANNLVGFVYGNVADIPSENGSTLLLVAILGAMHIYCDFSGYSDIAIGTARILGFDLMKNFDFPFFSRSIAEFWQKWHISLITWFRDYLVTFLKGFTKPKLMRNVVIVFFVTGLWHGASMTFIIWGLLNAALFIPIIFGKRRRKFRGPVAAGRMLPTARETYQMVTTYSAFMLIGAFFVVPTVSGSALLIYKIFSPSLFTLPNVPSIKALFIFVLLIVEWIQREKEHGLDLTDSNVPALIRWGVYFLLIFSILIFSGETTEFVYFQF